MNTIAFPKLQNNVMLQALQRVDSCPKQNYEILDITTEGKIDPANFIGFIPQTTRQTFTLLCKECSSMYKLVLEYSVSKDTDCYEVISCEPY